MSLTLAQRLDRLKVRIAELESWKVRATAPLAAIAFDGAPIEVGAPWPRKDGSVHFTLEGLVPADWPLAETWLSLDLGGESLIAIVCDGGDPVSYGLDPYHQSFPLSGRSFKVATETVARLLRTLLLTGENLRSLMAVARTAGGRRRIPRSVRLSWP